MCDTCEDKPTPEQINETRWLEAVHRDIDFGNRYRIELDKTLLLLAAGLFAFTVSFPPKLDQVDCIWLLAIGWLGLVLSMVGGFGELHGWERYYLTYRDHDYKLRTKGAGKPCRDKITKVRISARVMQFAGFFGGALCLGLFYLNNIDNLK